MANFKDILAQPLPSAANRVITEACEEGCKSDGCKEEGCQKEGAEPIDNVETGEMDNAIDPTEDVVLSDDSTNDVADPITPEPDTASDDEVDTTPLTPEQSRRVDDTMNAVATPLLLQKEMDEAALQEFVESVDCDIAVQEGFLTERTIVKFDKNARRSQLYEVAVAAVAREKKDPLYKKLQTVYKMERILKAKLRKKYHSQANAKVREYLANAKKSKTGILSKIANKLMGK